MYGFIRMLAKAAVWAALVRLFNWLMDEFLSYIPCCPLYRKRPKSPEYHPLESSQTDTGMHHCSIMGTSLGAMTAQENSSVVWHS